MSEPEPSRPGSILRAEREALGVTVREVAETLNLSMTVIEAIEADDRDRLPGLVFARGYVRAYARLLELEPEPLMAQYPRAPEVVPTVQAAREPPFWEWIRRHPGLVLGAGGVLAAVLLVLLVIWLWSGEAEQTDPGPTAAESAAAGPTPEQPGPRAGYPADVVRSPGNEPTPSGLTSETTGARGDAAVTAREPQPDRAGVAESLETTPDPGARDVGGTIRRVTATGEDRLEFEFAEDCWVEVRDTAGRSLYSDLSRAGSRLVLVGQAPFRILLGYAPGARLSFNGEAVPLVPHTRDNVATLVLGQ